MIHGESRPCGSESSRCFTARLFVAGQNHRVYVSSPFSHHINSESNSDSYTSFSIHTRVDRRTHNGYKPFIDPLTSTPVTLRINFFPMSKQEVNQLQLLLKSLQSVNYYKLNSNNMQTLDMIQSLKLIENMRT